MMDDPEAMYDDMANPFSEKSIRMGFIRKVYGILSIQLLITFGLVSIFTFVPAVSKFAYDNPAVFWAAFGITLGMIILLGCCGNFRRKTPHNYIALFVFTICEAYLMGSAAATYDAWEVTVAIVVTLVVVFGLTLFAFQTKYDFTTMNGLLMSLLLVLIMFGIFAGIFRSDIMRIVYASLGALLFCFYIVFDTQLLIGGSHKLAISAEEYVFAALNIYLDVVNLFMFILALVGGGRN